MFRYFLTYQEERNEVEEPANIKDVTSVLRRDFETHGSFFQFTAGDLTASFHCKGRKILEDAYMTEGVNAKVLFEIEYRAELWDDWVRRFTGIANMSRRKIDADYFECSFYSDDLSIKISDRIDTTINLEAEETLDGEPIDMLESSWANMHSKTIKKAATYKLNSAFLKRNYSGVYPEPEMVYVVGWQMSNSDLDGAQEPGHVRWAQNGVMDAIQNGNFFYSGQGSRNISISGSLAFSIRNTATSSTGQFEVAIYKYQRVSRELSKVSTLTTSPYNSSFINYKIPIGANIALSADESLHFLLIVTKPANDTGPRGAEVNFNEQESSMIVSEDTTTDSGTVVSCYKLFDSVNQTLKIITGKEDFLKSELLSTGAGAGHVITNGFKLREFPDRPLEISLKNQMENMACLWNIGYGIQGPEDDPKFVVEPMRYFYSGGQILELKDVSEYEETVDEEHLINSLKIGFSKYAQNEGESNTIDEVHTQHEYFLPVSGVKKEKAIICDWILSAYLIEITRRQSYELKPTESYKHDNDIFFISSKETIMPELTIRNPFNGELINLGGTILAAERNEAFKYVANILDPTTMYNLRLTPKRLLLNWGEYLNSFMYYNKLTDLVKNQQSLINKLATTQLLETEAFPLGDEQGFRRVEGENEEIQNIFSGKRVFRPEIVKFRKEMCEGEIELIIDAMLGRLSNGLEAANNGYISVENYNKEMVQCFILEMRWNYLDRVAEFTCIKKGVDPELMNVPGILWELLDTFMTTEDGKVIILE